jgi:hypothetical protein
VVGSHLLYAVLAMNPIGGLPIAIPFAIFKLGYPVWLAFMIAVPCSYVQVLTVDLAWNQLNRLERWRAMFERQRSPRIEKLVASGGAFWPTLIIAPLVGPWIVMAFMRYAQVPQRRVALPILIGMACLAGIILALCVYMPQLLRK